MTDGRSLHPQLETLLQIQDLKSQRRELAEIESERRVEEIEFNVDVEHALGELDERVAEMEAQLAPAIRARYQRISAGRGRAVVPMINGTCYGCFVSIPTSMVYEIVRGDQLWQCDNCGRFLYGID